VTLDRIIDENSRLFNVIYSSETNLKGNSEKLITVNILSPIYNADQQSIFPVLVNYVNPQATAFAEIHDPVSLPSIAGFEVTKKISESNNSLVYEAFHTFENKTRGSRVIIKFLKAEKEDPAEIEFYQFFCNDIIGCEFIEKPFRIDLTQMPAIFMESSSSQIDLFEFIDKNDILPDGTVRNIFSKLAKAIGYLHSHSIVHFDIKVYTYILTNTNVIHSFSIG